MGGPFHLKKQRWSRFPIFPEVAILKIFYLNLEQSIIVGYQFSYSYDFGKSEIFERTGYVNQPVYYTDFLKINTIRNTIQWERAVNSYLQSSVRSYILQREV
jgi:hypothetical protein